MKETHFRKLESLHKDCSQLFKYFPEFSFNTGEHVSTILLKKPQDTRLLKVEYRTRTRGPCTTEFDKLLFVPSTEIRLTPSSKLREIFTLEIYGQYKSHKEGLFM